MAKGDEVAAVFEILEKVFNPETEFEYDEALEELGLPVAKTRKTYPNLFKALQFPSRLERQAAQVAVTSNGADVAAIEQRLLAAIQSAQHNGNGHVAAPAVQPQQPQGPAPVAEALRPEDEIPLIRTEPWSTWAVGTATRSRVGDEFAVEWDSAAPMIVNVSESFTLKRPPEAGGGRGRYQLIEMYSATALHLKMVALLPNAD